ncbi:hypothetical protein F0231_03790 [Vibrio sp. RE86]|uniref:hypothetical protein n=1 Tax=Vibrio sp. RE86 TaxID=2607605 RepID=UPI001493906C|nr:hypothetical protein [Vibrio sp. RE86]NOH78861.1 hypothetical protein [Vibrio sp. RE86]
MFEVVPRNDQRSPLKLMEDHILSSPDDPWTTCPWVKVGDLYLSVTQTGNSSWPTLVKHLNHGGGYVVFSGRHGTQAGQAVDASTGQFNQKYVMERQFYLDDVKAAKQFGSKVEVLDVANFNTTEKLKTATIGKTGQGKVVIYAWCHSMFSMMDHNEDMYGDTYNVNKGGTQRNFVVESRALTLVNQSVKTLSSEWYSWST